MFHTTENPESFGNTVILGAPGSGKSVLLKKMMADMQGSLFFMDTADNYMKHESVQSAVLEALLRVSSQETFPLTVCIDGFDEITKPYIHEINRACRLRKHIRLIVTAQSIVAFHQYQDILQNVQTVIFMKSMDPETNAFAERAFGCEHDLRTLRPYKAIVFHHGNRMADFYGVAA